MKTDEKSLEDLSGGKLKDFDIFINDKKLDHKQKDLFKRKFFERSHVKWLAYLISRVLLGKRLFSVLGGKEKLYSECVRIRYEFTEKKQNAVLTSLGFEKGAEITIKDDSKLDRLRNNVTLAAIAGSGSEESFKKHLQALIYSNRGINFKHILIICPTNFENKYAGCYSWVRTELWDGYAGYNEFCIKDLHKHVQTEHLLLIQDDGFILNPDLWTDEFLNYDYVGSASPPRISFNDELIYNGGFSLRSKKLLELCGRFKEYKYKSDCVQEDVFIFKNYKYFIENNMKFPSPLIASIFSNAHDNDFSFIKSFGFHGKMNAELMGVKDAINLGSESERLPTA